MSTKPQHFRIPDDVLTAAKARAASEHRTLTDVVVRLLRAYGEALPADPAKPARPRSAQRRPRMPEGASEIVAGLRRSGAL